MKNILFAALLFFTSIVPAFAVDVTSEAESLTAAQKEQLEAALHLAPPDSRIKFSWMEEVTRIEGAVIKKPEAQAYASRLLKAGIFGDRLLHLSVEENGAFRIEIAKASDSKN